MEQNTLTKAARSVANFETLFACLSIWFIGGIYTDGWAHNHLDSALETFLTPWHAALYSGFTVCALALFIRALMHRTRGRSIFSLASWKDALPEGYYLSLIGAGIFALGGGFDAAWHSLFGIEKDLEALISPAHLVLAVGGFLMFSGPLRSAWSRSNAEQSAREWFPVVVSLICTLSIVTFMTMFAHPIRHFATGMHPYGAVVDYGQGRAVAGIFWQMALLTGLTLLCVRRWGKRLPPGFFGVIYGANMAGMALLIERYEWRLVPAAIIAGLVADGLNRSLRMNDACHVRIFSALVPFVYVFGVFLTLLLTDDVWWSVHMWSGTAVLAGIVGLLVSFVALPPRVPEATR